MPIPLADLPLPVIGVIFAVAAALLWGAGTRLSGYADGLSRRTGIGAAVTGALFLGGITSLPEVVTSVTASAVGDADMAVNNLLGGIAMQVAILAVADFAVPAAPLSSLSREPTTLLQGAFLILTLAIVAAGIIIGEPGQLPIGLWSTGVLGVAIAAFALIHRSEGREAWGATEPGGELEPRPAEATDGSADGRRREDRATVRGLLLRAAVAALLILVAGYVITRAGETIAARTGLGSSFVGAALVAVSTSLPEVSTTIGAARLGRYDIAISNIFGANILDGGFVFLVDATYAGPPVLGQLGDFALLAALLGIALTALFLVGLVRRRTRGIGRIGIDSAAVIALYLAGLYALFRIR